MLTRRKFFKLTAAGVLSGCIAEPRKAEAKPEITCDWLVHHNNPSRMRPHDPNAEFPRVAEDDLNLQLHRMANRLYEKHRRQASFL